VLPTIAELLDLPEIRRGNPIVLAGNLALDHEVRWVHVSELPDIGSMLAGGEVLLTTGVALPTTDDALRRYVYELAGAEIAGLFVGLGRGFDRCPEPIIRAAEECDLPLVELRSTIPFVRVTEAVHSLIVNRHMVELRNSERTHEIFTTLELEGAPLATILREAAILAQAPVVLEDLAHRVLAYDTNGQFDAEVLFAWEERSRACRRTDRTTEYQDIGWIATDVGARGNIWGRLIGIVGERSRSQQRMVLERAASTIAIHRLLERDVEAIELAARRALLTDLIERTYGSADDLLARAAAVGVVVKNRTLIPVAVRLDPAEHVGGDSRRMERDAVRAIEHATRTWPDSVLVAATSSDTIGLLLTHDAAIDSDEILRPVARAIHDALDRLPTRRTASIGVGAQLRTLTEVGQGMLQACEATSGSQRGLYNVLPDVHIRGLLFLLRDDARVQAFVERELGPLLDLDPQRRADLLATLRTYLHVGRNKSLAADALHMSRPALYHRLRSLEELLRVNLDDVEACLSLHTALIAYEER
jgi:purine catabolism regulator